jgi:hypothetical protein
LSFPVVGCEYVVFAIDAEATPPRGILPVNLLLLNELRHPSWVAAAEFSVTSSWRAKLTPTGELWLAPWQREGFWGDLHGGGRPSKRAREVFEHEVALIEAEDALPQ